jgi:hypothetical protein
VLIDGLHARRRIKVEAHSPASRDGVGSRFIVIVDSHIRQPDQESAAYPSSAWLVQRNEFIVRSFNPRAALYHLIEVSSGRGRGIQRRCGAGSKRYERRYGLPI